MAKKKAKKKVAKLKGDGKRNGINTGLSVGQFVIMIFENQPTNKLTDEQIVELLDEDCVTPEGFRLENYIREGKFQYPLDSSTSSLKLRVNQNLIFFFKENELGLEQKVLKVDDHTYEVTCQSLITEELEWWLLGRSDLIEVIEPQRLRERIHSRLKIAVSTYGFYAT